MGRLEKQIIIGALVLVGVLLSVVVIKGLKPRSGNPAVKPPLLVVDIPLVGPKSAAQQPPNIPETKSWPVEPRKTPATVVDIPLQPVAAPPQKQPVLAGTLPKPGPRSYTIRYGDTLSEIAQQQLGSSKPVFVQRLLDANPGVTAQNIKEGDVLILPAVATQLANSAASTRAMDSGKTAAGGRNHVVVSDDSLWKIARKYYGVASTEKNIDRIVAANPQLTAGKNSVLRIGRVLVIPE